MRIGNNPNRDTKIDQSSSTHRIIIPVYIPNLSDYYKESFQVFKICIASLLTTKSITSSVTIVNNGCCTEVFDYINDLFQNNKINEIIHTENVGKVNSILKAIRTSSEPYITITDADILFKEHWLDKTIDVFNQYPKAGVVGIIPQFKMYEYLGYNVIADNLFNSKLKFTKVKDPEGLKHFYKSIGWKDDYNKNYLRYNLSITDNNITAIIGSGHCVATYKRILFDNNIEFSKFALGGRSENMYLDEPCVKKDFWRLTTEENLAFHMGNSTGLVEEEYVKALKINSSNSIFKILEFNEHQFSLDKMKYFVKTKLMRRVLKTNLMKGFFFTIKGLPKEILNQY